jgi:hypothetical protein
VCAWLVWVVVVVWLCRYLSVGFVLLIVKHFGATMAEVVKSCRKVGRLTSHFKTTPAFSKQTPNGVCASALLSDCFV